MLHLQLIALSIFKIFLDSLHGNFTIALIDKTNDYIVIFCKCFYRQVLIKELRKDDMLNTSSIYEYLQNTRKETLILFHSNFILTSLFVDIG